MADDKQGREEQARSEENRQREREVAEQRERWDESEPPVETETLDGVETDLESLAFPATGAEVVAAAGDREIESTDGIYAIEELVADTDEETFQSPSVVRARVRRPTVAAALKRIVEAGDRLQNVEFGTSQRDAYEKTLRALAAIDADDDDEGIRVVTDWVVEQIRDKGKLPGSRAVRRQAAKYCRANGYQVRNDEWLGI